MKKNVEYIYRKLINNYRDMENITQAEVSEMNTVMTNIGELIIQANS